MTDENIAELLEALHLDTSFDKLKFGGMLTTLNLTFRIPYSMENHEFLKHVLGRHWLDYVEISDENDDGIDTAKFPAEGKMYVAGLAVHSPPLMDLGEFGTDPVNPGQNNVYTNTVDSTKYVYTGSAWMQFGYLGGFGTAPIGTSFLNNTYLHIIDEDTSTLYVYDGSTWVEAGPYTYRHYRFHVDRFKTLTGERLSEIAAQFVSMVSSTRQPCPNDKILTIIVIVALTFASGGTAGPSALALLSMALSVGLTLGIFTGDQAKIVQAALIVLALYGSIDALMNEGLNEGLMTTMRHSMAIANTAIGSIEMYQQLEHDESMKDMQKKTSQVQEDLAEDFEQAFRFTYSGSYDNIYRDGHERAADASIKTFYDEFSVY